MTHLLAVYDNVSNQVYEIPSGMTAEEFADQLGLAPENWAAFNLADYPGCEKWDMAFVLVDNLPSPNTVTFNLTTAKEYADLIVRSQSAAVHPSLLDGYSTVEVAAQASLPSASREPRFQLVLDDINAEILSCIQRQTDIAAAATIAEVNAIVFP